MADWLALAPGGLLPPELPLPEAPAGAGPAWPAMRACVAVARPDEPLAVDVALPRAPPGVCEWLTAPPRARRPRGGGVLWLHHRRAWMSGATW